MSEDAQDSWRQPLQDFIAALRRAGVDLTGREIAEAVWLAAHLPPGPGGVEVPAAPAEEPEPEVSRTPPRPESSVSTPAPILPEPEAPVVLPSPKAVDATRKPLPIRSPGAPALPHARALARALRPLKRSVPSRRQAQLDEQATAERIAGGGPWMPVMRPARSRWLEVALVVDASRSMVVWRRTLEELRGLLRYHGAFRDVRAWSLVTDASDGRLRLYQGLVPAPLAPERHRRELVEPLGRRLILVASDCVSPSWHSGAVEDWLHQWSRHQPTAILEMLPQHLWGRTGLRRSPGLWLHGTEAGVPNRRLFFGPSPGVFRAPRRGEVAMPVVTLEREALADWVRVVLGLPGAWSPGVLLREGPRPTVSVSRPRAAEGPEPGRVSRFDRMASATARKLARMLAAVPLSLDVMQLVREVFVPEAEQTNLAEVFLGGLMEVVSPPDGPRAPGETRYEFLEGVRDVLLESIPVPDALDVLSRYVEERLGQAINFQAWLDDPSQVNPTSFDKELQPFARVAASVLSKLGGEYANLAKRLRHAAGSTARPDAPRMSELERDYALAMLRFIGGVDGAVFEPASLERSPGWARFLGNLASMLGLPATAVPVSLGKPPTDAAEVFQPLLPEALPRLVRDFKNFSTLEDYDTRGARLQERLAPFLVQKGGGLKAVHDLLDSPSLPPRTRKFLQDSATLGWGAERIVFKEPTPSDLKKFQARSAVSGTGGGARDLRFSPYEAFEPIFRKLFPETRMQQRRRGGVPASTPVFVGRFSWRGEKGEVLSKEASFEPPTDARRGEGRIRVVHTYPTWSALPPQDEGRVLAVLLQHTDGTVWPHFVTEDFLRSELWEERASKAILKGLDVPRSASQFARGYFDFKDSREFYTV